MLVNDIEEIKEDELARYSQKANIEFVRYYNYDKYCSLCFGILELKIDGNITIFGPKGSGANCEGFFTPTVCYAGGDIESNSHTLWSTDVTLLPEKYKPFAKEIDTVINQNMPNNICRGCD